MSKVITENKFQLIHIASEIFLILGIVIYFSKKNKLITNNINTLTNRLKSLEEHLEEQKRIIKQMMLRIPKQTDISHILDPSNMFSSEISKKPYKEYKTSNSFPKYNNIHKNIDSSDRETSDDESDLDAEIQDELNDLNERNSSSRNSLKKKQ